MSITRSLARLLVGLYRFIYFSSVCWVLSFRPSSTPLSMPCLYALPHPSPPCVLAPPYPVSLPRATSYSCPASPARAHLDLAHALVSIPSYCIVPYTHENHKHYYLNASAPSTVEKRRGTNVEANMPMPVYTMNLVPTENASATCRLVMLTLGIVVLRTSSTPRAMAVWCDGVNHRGRADAALDLALD